MDDGLSGNREWGIDLRFVGFLLIPVHMLTSTYNYEVIIRSRQTRRRITQSS